MIIRKFKFFSPDYYFELFNKQGSDDDFEFEVPHIEYNQKVNIILHKYGEEDCNDLYPNVLGLEFIRLAKITYEYIEAPLRLRPIEDKTRVYIVTSLVKDKLNRYIERKFTCRSLHYVIQFILPYVNKLMSDGYDFNDIDWNWIESECLGLYFSSPRCESVEELYDYASSFKIRARHVGINRPGKDDISYDQYVLTFENVNKYISKLLGEALKAKPEYNNKEVTYIITKNHESAYSFAKSWDIPQEEAERVKEEFTKIIRIYCIRKFDLESMRESLFLRSDIAK